MSLWLVFTRYEGECRVWTRCFNSDGYPRAGNKSNTNLKIHREVFCDVNGYMPDVVRHSCDNIRCINPEHLVAGTQLDNILDRSGRGRTFGHVRDEDYEACKSLRAVGKTYKQIAEALNIKIKRVEYILTRARKEG